MVIATPQGHEASGHHWGQGVRSAQAALQGLETSPRRKPSHSSWVHMTQGPHSSTVLWTHCHHSCQSSYQCLPRGPGVSLDPKESLSDRTGWQRREAVVRSMLGYPGTLGGWKRNIKNRVRARGAGGREMLRVGTIRVCAHDCSGEGGPRVLSLRPPSQDAWLPGPDFSTPAEWEGVWSSLSSSRETARSQEYKKR